jgi:hypothetical protein
LFNVHMTGISYQGGRMFERVKNDKPARVRAGLALVRGLETFLKWSLGLFLVQTAVAFKNKDGEILLVTSWSNELRDHSYRAKINLRNDLVNILREQDFKPHNGTEST